ncbi:MAG: hypothetical protein Q9207_007175 [Kuettlingeria erythrocarpa]
MDGTYLPRDVRSAIKYIKNSDLYRREKPFQILIDIPEDVPDQRFTNLVYDAKEEIFHDVRGKEQEYSLNDNGFMYRQHNFGFDDYEDRSAVEAHYLPKIDQLIRAEVEDVDKVFLFDWRVRHQVTSSTSTSSKLKSIENSLDITLHYHVWKPLRKPVEDWPLAVCDGSNLEEDDVLETDHVRRQYNGANMNALYREKYRWYYLHRQGPEELLILKQFDSAANVKVIRAPIPTARKCPS